MGTSFCLLPESALALTKEEAQFLGYKAGGYACESLQIDLAETMDQVYKYSFMNMYKDYPKEMNIIGNALEKYGKEHPMFIAFYDNYVDTIFDNCPRELDEIVE